MNYDYNIPISFASENNNTEITKKTFQFKDCAALQPGNIGAANCNICPNDDSYCQPYVPGDKINFQLGYLDGIKNYCELPVIYLVADGVETLLDYYPYNHNGVETQVGTGTDLVAYLNMVIDTSNAIFANKKCWYLKIDLLYCPDEEMHHFYSEQYCEIGCNEKTILIQGQYVNGYDCNGNYYGPITFGGNTLPNIFQPSVRVRGVVEPAGYEFEETKNNNIKVKSKQREAFTLFTKKIPYYVAQQMAACFNSKQLTIDGVNYSGALKLTKNFDEGLMWIIKETIYIDCDEINFTCD